MFIRHVDSALEQLLRTRLHLTEDLADIAFEAPSSTWSAQLSRITVNLYLYDVQRSTQPSRSPMRATPGQANGGTATVRRPQPMMQLGYLVSTWAGTPRDEHQLLGDLASLVAGIDTIPQELLPDGLSSSVAVAVGDDRNLPRELWAAVGGTLRPSLTLRLTVAADTFGWETPAPAVERIAGMVDRMAERRA